MSSIASSDTNTPSAATNEGSMAWEVTWSTKDIPLDTSPQKPTATTTNLSSGSSPPAPAGQRYLNDLVMKNFCIAKLFHHNKGVVSHVAFTADGHYALTSASDDQLNLFDCKRGTHERTYFSKKYGCDLATFTHSAKNILHASTKLGHELRYLSLHDNKYLRYFTGHTGKVTNLNMSPADDSFLSSSLDKTVRLWDLRSPTCQGLLQLPEPAVASFDPEGLIFGTFGHHNDINAIRLYDVRAFESGPFCSFLIPETDKQHANAKGVSMTFNPNGKQIMINTDGPYIQIVDSFQGKPVFLLERHLYSYPVSKKTRNFDVCFSPDGKYIMSTDGTDSIIVWSSSDGRCVTILNPHAPSSVGAFKFNPKMLMFVTAEASTAFWLQREPDIDTLANNEDAEPSRLYRNSRLLMCLNEDED